MSLTDELRRLLDELGIEWWNETDPEPQRETVADIGDEIAFYHENVDGSIGYSTHNKHGLTPKQAIAATVGGTVCEPSKEWKAWYESLRHDNPSNVREAVENILFDAIDFGGDMGPNGNVWSGVDEGDALTEKCIDEWVRSIESVGATVGWTCHISVQDNLAETEGIGDVWLECDECHWQMPFEPTTLRFKYCPNCGRRVAE